MMAVNTIQQLPFDAVSADDHDADLVRINNLTKLSTINMYNVNEKYDHSTYPLANYGLELQKGGGVSLYLHESLQYKSRKDLFIGGDTNSVFVL